jgi:putative glutamine amidotransferase
MKCGISLSIKPEYNTWGDFLFREYVSFFEKLGIKVIFIPNSISDVALYMKKLSLEGLILSGGNDIIVPAKDRQKHYLSSIRNLQEKNILGAAIKMKIPVLGICRGMQFINYYFGGTVSRDIDKITGVPLGHVKTVHGIIIEDRHLISLLKRKGINVNSYHRQGVFEDQLSPRLKVAARSGSDGLIEALYHPLLPVMGIQWHPERKSPDNAANKKIITAFKNRVSYWSRKG